MITLPTTASYANKWFKNDGQHKEITAVKIIRWR